MKIGTLVLVMVILMVLLGGLISEYIHQGEDLNESRDENQHLYSVIHDLKTSLENAYIQIEQLVKEKNMLKQENETLQSILRDAYTENDRLNTKVETLELENQHLQQLSVKGDLAETDDATPKTNLPTQIMIAVVFLAGGIGSKILIKNTTAEHKKAHLEKLADTNNTAFIRVTRAEAQAIASWRRSRKSS